MIGSYFHVIYDDVLSSHDLPGEQFRHFEGDMWAMELCVACLGWLCGFFYGPLILLTNEYAGCGRPTLNFIERFWLGSVRSASKALKKAANEAMNISVNISKNILMFLSMNCIAMHNCTEMYEDPDVQNVENLKEQAERRGSKCKDQNPNDINGEATSILGHRLIVYMELFSMKVNLKVLCILLLCIILADTSKASENLTFLWNQRFTLLCICVVVATFWLSAMKIKQAADNVALLFENWNMIEEEVVVGRSRFEQFYCIPSNVYVKENRTRPRRSREPSRVPLNELSRVLNKDRKSRRLLREYISKNVPKSSKVHDYTRAYVLHNANAFRERARKQHGNNRKPQKCKEKIRINKPSLRESYKFKKKFVKSKRGAKVRLYFRMTSRTSISRPAVFRDRNHKINYYAFSLSRDIEKNPGPSVVDPNKTIIAPYSQGNAAIFGDNAGRQCVAMFSSSCHI